MFSLFWLFLTCWIVLFIIAPTYWWLWIGFFLWLSIVSCVWSVFYKFFTTRLYVSIWKVVALFLLSWVIWWVAIYIQHSRLSGSVVSERVWNSQAFESIVITWRIVGKRRWWVSELVDGTTWVTYLLRGDMSTWLRVGEEVVTQWLVSRAIPVYHSVPYSGVAALPSVIIWEFDYSTWLWLQGYGGDVRAKSVLVTWMSRLSFREKLREELYARIKKLYTWVDQQALLAGMLYGDISQMSNETYDSFVTSSLVHLVAVSWWNVIFVLFVLYIVLIRLPVYVRMVVMCLWVVGYVLLVWLDGSLTRAMIMWLLAIGALFAWRSVDVRRALWVARCIYLLISPYSLVFDLWFLLSFWALTGIVYMSRFMEILGVSSLIWWISKTLIYLVKEYLFANIWAFLWVIPVLLFFIWSFNLRWWLANLFVLPVVPVVMAFWFLSLVFESFLFSSFPILYFIWDVLVSLVTVCLEYVILVSTISASTATMVDVSEFSILHRYAICLWCCVLYVSIYVLWIRYVSYSVPQSISV